MAERIGVYPGSFDPPTHGHLDLMRRASRIFDKVIVAIANNTEKHNLFSYEERVEMITEITHDIPELEVRPFTGLIVDLAREVNAVSLIRGLRAVSDFENEMTMAATNQKMLPSCDTISFMPNEQYMFISSRLVKEIAVLGGDIAQFVPETVAVQVNAKLKKS